MKVVFFEVQDWEQDLLKSSFPDSLLVSDKLDKTTVGSYSDAEVISCFIYSSVTKETLDLLPQLKYIATRSTGYDHIDLEYCKTKNISVSNVPEYGSSTVAEHAFALLLSLTRKIYQSVNQSKNLNFEHEQIRGVDLEGRTIGIIGLGKIGLHVLKIAHGFGMNVLAYNHSRDETLAQKYGFKYVELNDLLKNSDVVTLHLPLTEQTKHIINKENILTFKKGSYLINTARGGLVETEAVLHGLDKNILEGVGLDVLEEEKELGEEVAILTSEYRSHADLKNLIYDHILINHPKVLITPHNAFNSQEALRRITDTTIINIQGYISGKPLNIVG